MLSSTDSCAGTACSGMLVMNDNFAREYCLYRMKLTICLHSITLTS